MTNVPANTSPERRRSPRIEILAQAEIVGGQEIRIMEVRNISSEGIFLAGTPEQYPDLGPGVDLDLAISSSEEGSDDAPGANIACHARIVRFDPGEPGVRPAGFGATIDPIDDENWDRLTKLLTRASRHHAG